MRMLSGRYRCETLTKHWTPSNEEGWCQLPGCLDSSPTLGSLEHLLLHCPNPALVAARQRHAAYTVSFLADRPHLADLVNVCSEGTDQEQVQFLLDCSTVPAVIIAAQSSETDVVSDLFKLTRNFCFMIHNARTRQLIS